MSLFEAILLAIVEGITEFLPISSTGHMIITEKLLGMKPDEFNTIYIISIQFGAILSVIVLYWKRFIQSVDFYKKLLVAFIPAAVIGKLFGDYVDMILGSVEVVAVSLLLGGVILIFIDKWLAGKDDDDEITYFKALKIGLFQCIAMIPGVSRSAATIIGGMSQRLTRKTAAEFSFFLAVPTMFAATVYKLYKNHAALTSDKIGILLIGNVVAFFVALLAIKFFISFLQKHGFKLFGYYRITLGLILLTLLALGYDLNLVD
ncbi:MAG: undecaprenyl-diphosphate phosphatase [Chitinophagales bacterium]|nr:undecaprenyl-diphosphate phosphatase [Chitinophagales bacterium]